MIRRGATAVAVPSRDRQDLSVPLVPIYIQEEIHPQALVENLRDTAGAGEPEPELSLFSDFNGIHDFEQKVDFYHHQGNGSNRMILGDSLMVMAELTGRIPPDHRTAGDIRKGFVYKRVPHVTLKSIANNPDIREGMSRAEIDAAIGRHADTELLFDKPQGDEPLR